MAKNVKSKRRTRAPNKRRSARPGVRVLAALFLVLLAAAAYFWVKGQYWQPAEEQWPDQGALVGDGDGPVDFTTLRGLGASFVYLEASDGAEERDRRFAGNLQGAREAGLQIGALHRFDPCVPADGQSANFVTSVPRDADLLPPAIALDTLAENCPTRVSDAAVQSELMTLVNQIEMHTGKAAILTPSIEFEEEYEVARRIDRHLWLTRSYFEPQYAGRPWLLWTANETLRTEAAEQPLRWVVVRP